MFFCLRSQFDCAGVPKQKSTARVLFVWYSRREYSPLARGVRKAAPCLAERPARVRCVRVSFLYLRSQFDCVGVPKQKAPQGCFSSGTPDGNTRRWLVACARLRLAWLSDPLAFDAFGYRFFIYARSSIAWEYQSKKHRKGAFRLVLPTGIEPITAP